MFTCVLVVLTTSLSGRTSTLGRQTLSRNVWLISVKIPLEAIRRSVKASGIPQEQHVYCRFKIHTQNTYQYISRANTQNV